MSGASLTPLEWLGFEVAVQEALYLHRKWGVARLIRVMVQHPDRTLRVDQLITLCKRYGFAGVHPRSLKIYICFAREALDDLGFPTAINTVYGIGYSMPAETADKIRDYILGRLA